MLDCNNTIGSIQICRLIRIAFLHVAKNDHVESRTLGDGQWTRTRTQFDRCRVPGAQVLCRFRESHGARVVAVTTAAEPQWLFAHDSTYLKSWWLYGKEDDTFLDYHHEKLAKQQFLVITRRVPLDLCGAHYANDIHGSAARKNRQKLIVIIIIALVPDEKSPNEMRYEYFIVLIIYFHCAVLESTFCSNGVYDCPC